MISEEESLRITELDIVEVDMESVFEEMRLVKRMNWGQFTMLLSVI